jgi:hypothetical protein
MRLRRQLLPGILEYRDAVAGSPPFVGCYQPRACVERFNWRRFKVKSEMTIGKKLTISFGGLLTLTVGLGCSSLLSMEKLGKTIDETVNTMAKRADLAYRMRASIWMMRTGQRGMIM